MSFNKYIHIELTLKHILSLYLSLGTSDDFRIHMYIYNICDKARLEPDQSEKLTDVAGNG